MNFADKFTPYELDRTTVATLELQSEMIERASEIFALYYDAIAGFDQLMQHFEEWKHQLAQDLSDSFGITVDERTWAIISPLRSAVPHGQELTYDDFLRSLADYRMRLDPKGRNTVLIGNYLLIALYQFWEDSWRGRIAAIRASNRNKIASDYWGDLRLIRICLIHKQGVADDDLEQKSIKFRWFRRGDQILIDRPKVEAIVSGFREFVHSELHSYNIKSA